MNFFIQSQVKPFATFGDFPATGQVKTIYIDEATSEQYYWNGLAYISLSTDLTGYVPYTGATGNVDLGTHTLSAKNIIVNHPSGSGVAVSITKGGSGEALTITKTSGSGNAMSVTGGNVQFGTGFFWDSTNERLGIGTDTPSQPLTIKFAGQSGWDLVFFGTGSNTHNISGGNTLVIGHNFLNMQNSSTWAYSGTNKYFSVGVNANLGSVFGVKGLGNTSATSAIIIQNSSATELLRIWNDGAVGIGVGGTNAGYKLDVNGTTRVKGVGTTSSTTAFTVQNSSGTTNFFIKDDGQLASSGTDSYIYSNFTTGNKSPLLFSHSGYGTATPNDTRIDIGFRGRQPGGLNSYDFLTYKIFQGTDPNVTTGFEFYTHQNQSGASASVLAMSINGGNVGIGITNPAQKLSIAGNNFIMFTGVSAQNMPAYIGTDSSDNFYAYSAGQGSGKSSYFGPSNGTHLRTIANFLDLYVGNGAPILGLRLNSTGNILIGTTTDAGFRLDVNGTARVSSTLGVGGALVSGGSGFGNTMLSLTSTYPCLILNSTGGTASKVGFNLDASKLYFSEETNNAADWGHRIMANTKIGGLVVLNNTAAGSTAVLNASAVLQADSTTRGFLPPRMTTTQRNAIASPAEGLQVWDTTLKLMFVYNGTTWISL